ncbi:MAG: cytochrome c peroxidase [Pseudomonadota bacterium]
MQILFCIFALFLCSTTSAYTFAQWNEKELSVIKSLSLSSLPDLPPSPSNKYADDPLAQSLGEKLFFDKNLSINGSISCASCHHPDKLFTDGLPRGVGVNATGRNTPTIVGSAWQRWFYWDGRKDSLWSQALIPFEAPNEMGSSRLAVVRHVVEDDDYGETYQRLFGPVNPLLGRLNLPANAGPLGDKTSKDNWFRLSNVTQGAINTAFSNIGKALEAYQRTLIYKPTRFDRYVRQLMTEDNKSPLLDQQEIAGLKLFINPEKTQCLQCHNGATFTNGGFHNIGTGTFTGEALDLGRFLGLQAVLRDEFNCLGKYSDAKLTQCSQLRFLNKAHHIPLQGAFKTPSLRHLSQTSPYFHDGRLATLEEVIAFYNEPATNNGPHELVPLNLSEDEIAALSAFLKTLE